MCEQAGQDRVVVGFTGAEAGTQPLTWGQQAIWQDMQASGNQFSMGGRFELPEGSTVEDAAAVLSTLMRQHAALRMRLGTDRAGPAVPAGSRVRADKPGHPDGPG